MRDLSASYWFTAGDSVRVVADDVEKAGFNLQDRVGTVVSTWEKCDVDPTCCCAEMVDPNMAVRVEFQGTEEDPTATTVGNNGATSSFIHYFGEDELIKVKELKPVPIVMHFTTWEEFNPFHPIHEGLFSYNPEEEEIIMEEEIRMDEMEIELEIEMEMEMESEAREMDYLQSIGRMPGNNMYSYEFFPELIEEENMYEPFIFDGRSWVDNLQVFSYAPDLPLLPEELIEEELMMNYRGPFIFDGRNWADRLQGFARSFFPALGPASEEEEIFRAEEEDIIDTIAEEEDIIAEEEEAMEKEYSNGQNYYESELPALGPATLGSDDNGEVMNAFSNGENENYYEPAADQEETVNGAYALSQSTPGDDTYNSYDTSSQSTATDGTYNSYETPGQSTTTNDGTYNAYGQQLQPQQQHNKNDGTNNNLYGQQQQQQQQNQNDGTISNSYGQQPQQQQQLQPGTDNNSFPFNGMSCGAFKMDQIQSNSQLPRGIFSYDPSSQQQQDTSSQNWFLSAHLGTGDAATVQLHTVIIFSNKYFYYLFSLNNIYLYWIW